MTDVTIEALLEALADRIVDKWLICTSTRMVAQTGSPLGPRRHRAAVRRRLENGEGGATIVDRRHYLSYEALQEELSMRPPPKPEPPEPELVPAGPSDPTKPDTSAYARDLLNRLQSLRAPGKRRK